MTVDSFSPLGNVSSYTHILTSSESHHKEEGEKKKEITQNQNGSLKIFSERIKIE